MSTVTLPPAPPTYVPTDQNATRRIVQTTLTDLLNRLLTLEAPPAPTDPGQV